MGLKGEGYVILDTQEFRRRVEWNWGAIYGDGWGVFGFMRPGREEEYFTLAGIEGKFPLLAPIADDVNRLLSINFCVPSEPVPGQNREVVGEQRQN